LGAGVWLPIGPHRKRFSTISKTAEHKADGPSAEITLWLFEIANVLVRLDHVARFIVNAPASGWLHRLVRPLAFNSTR
jgi:hypothetical protein